MRMIKAILQWNLQTHSFIFNTATLENYIKWLLISEALKKGQHMRDEAKELDMTLKLNNNTTLTLYIILLIICVPLGKLFNLSMSQFPFL